MPSPFRALNLATPTPEVMHKLPMPLGLLAALGRVLDWPGRQLRELVTGEEDASGRRVLEKLGLLGRNKPGFDVGDIFGFGTEVLMDPLTYLGGIGTLTRSGKMAATVARRAGEVASRKALIKQAGKAVTKEAVEGYRSALGALKAARKAAAAEGVGALAKGWGPQALAGQRALIKAGIPFTRAEGTLVRGAPALARLEPLGRAIGKTAPVAFLSRLMRQTHGQVPEAQDIFRLTEAERAGVYQKAAGLEAEVSKIAPELGEPWEFSRIQESLGKPQEIAGFQGHLLNVQQRAIQRAEKLATLAHQKRLKKIADRSYRKSFRRAERLEAMADALQTYKPGQAEGLREKANLHLWEARRRIEQIMKRPLTKKEVEALAASKRKVLRTFAPKITWLAGKRRAAEDILAKATPEQIAGAERIAKIHGESLGRSIEVGARASYNILRAETKAYAPRMLTPEAKQFVRESGGEVSYGMSRQYSTKSPSQIKRQQLGLEEYTADVNAALSGRLPTGDWFEKGIAKKTVQHWLHEGVSQANAGLFGALAHRFSRAGEPGMELAEFLHKGPIHKFMEKELPSTKEGVEKVLEGLGMGGRTIPKAIADQAFAVHQKIVAPKEIGKLTKAFDAASGFLRFSVTSPFPAFHVRNFFSDTVLSWMGGGANPRYLPEALRLSFDPEHLAKMDRLGALRGSSVRTIAEDLGLREGGALANWPRTKKTFDWFSKHIAERTENLTRTWHFLSMKKKGFTDLEAAASVRKYLLDYRELAPFEREVLRRLFFFYNWPRKVTPLLIGQYFQQPGKMALLTRATTQPSIQRTKEPIPEYLRQTAAIPIGMAQGQPQFLVGSGSPLEELQKFDPTSPEGGWLGGLKQLLRKGVIQMNPMIRAPLEYAAGREFFYDRPIITGTRGYPALYHTPGLKQLFDMRKEELPGGKTRFAGDPLKLFWFRAGPASRLAKTGGQLLDLLGEADPRMSKGASLLQALTGVKLDVLDPYEQLQTLSQAQRNELTRLMREGKIGEIPIPFARTIGGEKAPEAVEALARNRALRKALKELREAQMQAPP